MATATDDFNRTETLTTPWTNPRNEFVANGTTISPSSITTDDAASIYNGGALASVGANQYAQVAITTVTGGSDGNGAGTGPSVRWANAFDHHGYRVVVSAAAANNVELSRFNTGTYAQLAQATQAFASGDILRLEVTGQDTSTILTVKRAPVGDPTNFSTLIGPLTDASGSAVNTGFPGISYSTLLTASALDNWEGGDLVTAVPPPIVAYVGMSQAVHRAAYY